MRHLFTVDAWCPKYYLTPCVLVLDRCMALGPWAWASSTSNSGCVTERHDTKINMVQYCTCTVSRVGHLDDDRLVIVEAPEEAACLPSGNELPQLHPLHAARCLHANWACLIIGIVIVIVIGTVIVVIIVIVSVVVVIIIIVSVIVVIIVVIITVSGIVVIIVINMIVIVIDAIIGVIIIVSVIVVVIVNNVTIRKHSC